MKKLNLAQIVILTLSLASLNANAEEASKLNDKQKVEMALKAARLLNAQFPVPTTPQRDRDNAFRLNESYYEFGADRGKNRKHKGIDIYGYGNYNKAEQLYAKGKEGFYSKDSKDWCIAQDYFRQIIALGKTPLRKKAQPSIRTLDKKLKKESHKCN